MSVRKPKRVKTGAYGPARMPAGYRGQADHPYHPTKGFRRAKGFRVKGRKPKRRAVVE